MYVDLDVQVRPIDNAHTLFAFTVEAERHLRNTKAYLRYVFYMAFIEESTIRNLKKHPIDPVTSEPPLFFRTPVQGCTPYRY